MGILFETVDEFFNTKINQLTAAAVEQIFGGDIT
jgi:hypothetical protein